MKISLTLVLLSVVVTSSAAAAEFNIVPGSLKVETLDGEGHPDNRAGAHPDRLLVNFELHSEGTGPKDLLFDLSPGFAGNQNAVPQCPRAIFDTTACPKNTQVGVVKQELFGETLEEPLFNIEPAPEQVLSLGASPAWKILFTGKLRGDYGLTIGSSEIAQMPLSGGQVELWGIPLDHQTGGEGGQRLPFLTTPTRCGPMSITFRTRSWENGAPWLSETAESAPLEGCQNLPFKPRAEFSLSDPVADTPTGVQMDISLPGGEDPDGVVNSQIKALEVEMPVGMSLSPSGIDGRSVCSDAELGLGGSAVATCPPTSKIGTVALESPQVGRALDGSVYIGQEHPGDRLRLFIVASSSAAEAKLVGSLSQNPSSGRLKVALSELPQLPLSHMTLKLDGGSRALLTTPLRCGPTTATASFEPHSGGSSVTSVLPVSIGGNPPGAPCLGSLPFAPGFVAGSANSDAGAPTSFSMSITRQDGEQSPDRFSVTLPPGLVAALGTVETCPDAAAASGNCPLGSKVGSAVAEVGAGPNPAALSGDAYLTGPYRQAPFGMVLAFHGKIGPFDFGTFLARAEVQVDRRTGQVTVDTTALPQSLEGLPIRFRTIGIDLNRPGFLSNPTSCSPGNVSAEIQAQEGSVAAVDSPFSLRGCNTMGFRPTFSMALRGRSELRDEGQPGLRFSVRLPRGGTNLRMISLQLPRLLRLNSSGLQEICTRSDAIANRCPKSSRVGSGYVRSPLFEKPLRGSVNIAQPRGNGFPDFWISLEGMGVELALLSETSQRHGRIVTKFVGLPDVPLSEFTMQLSGGDRGPLSLRNGFCARKGPSHLIAPVSAEGQNGAYRKMRVPVSAGDDCRGSRDVAAE